MGYKIFVSYKYKDNDVERLPGVTEPVWPRHYVDYMQKNVLRGEDIYKGEKSNEDISMLTEERIWEHLKEKIYDSSMTIVVISPNMKESHKMDKSQWIPWEISYSLRKQSRNNRTSQNNAILAIILPNKNGSYGYFDKDNLFRILKDNIESGYVFVEKWDNFVHNPFAAIKIAFYHKEEASPSTKI